MTNDELTMLRELHDAMLKPHGGKPPLIDQMQELRAALLDVPVGAGPEARPLLTRINAVVQLHERASWAMRVTVWLVSALGAISGGVLAVRGLWR